MSRLLGTFGLSNCIETWQWHPRGLLKHHSFALSCNLRKPEIGSQKASVRQWTRALDMLTLTMVMMSSSLVLSLSKASVPCSRSRVSFTYLTRDMLTMISKRAAVIENIENSLFHFALLELTVQRQADNLFSARVLQPGKTWLNNWHVSMGSARHLLSR